MSASLAQRTQREAALKNGNRKRAARSQLKAAVRTGETSVIDVLIDTDADVAGMRVQQLLSAVPRLGPKWTAWLMQQADIAPWTTIGELTSRQRTGLTRQFVEWKLR